MREIVEAVLAFDRAGCARLVREALDRGIEPATVLDRALIAAMDEVGDRYSNGELFVPEMLVSAETMKAGLAVLAPLLGERGAPSRGRIVIGTVHGDRHDIGKNLVALMLGCAGFEVTDLGVDVPAARFVEAARKQDADVVALSALINTTIPAMAETVAALRAELPALQTLVGGAPVTPAVAGRIGASGHAQSAPEAVWVARDLVGA